MAIKCKLAKFKERIGFTGTHNGRALDLVVTSEYGAGPGANNLAEEIVIDGDEVIVRSKHGEVRTPRENLAYYVVASVVSPSETGPAQAAPNRKKGTKADAKAD